ncbi:MAG: DUF952 domain-containing protein [Acidimicrobiales bacterium]|nr:DUF952 domain-containing protein [Acidimicrobiales bacterium]
MAETVLYHVTSAEAWHRAQATGRYEPESLAIEGFIHLSTAQQLDGTIARYFQGTIGLVVLEIDVSQVSTEVRYEESRPGEWFPHLYGPLEITAVRRIFPVEP